MLKQEGGGSAGGVGGVTGGGGGRWARVCDSCRASASVVYCRADVAYLCAGCDARIHAANRVASRHERVWVCEACENAPAAFTCKADAASLCTTCDADIHSANPLARRHHRDPILPISGCLYGPPETLLGRTSAGVVAAGDTFLGQEESEEIEEDEEEEEEGDNETESWLLLNNPVQVKNNNHNNNNNYNQSSCNGYVFGGGDVDEYLDLVEYNNSCTSTDHQYSVHHHHQQFHNQQQNQLELEINNSDASDSVVPDHHHQQQQQQNFQLEMENEASKVGFGYTGTIDISNSVSLSSMDASIVPDSTMNDISNSHSRAPKGTIDLFSSPPLQIPPHQCNPMDREARVLRYREKRKTRKFEKTIRYASRKAYAETRPRIKGRFAKRTDVEVEVDQIFSTSLMADNEYGVVPSF